MSWNIEDVRNIFFKLKSKLVLYHVVLTVQRGSPKKLTVIVVDMQNLPVIEKTDSKELYAEFGQINMAGEILCVKCKTFTDKLNIVVYRYRKVL